MKRCCVFAHFDPDDIVDPYVIRYLSALQPFVQKLVFVSTSRLSDEDIGRVEQLGATAICRENIGYDFCSWKAGIESLDLDEYDELLQANDSCYAPVFAFEPVFASMQKNDCDFWGITKSYTYGSHIQSYFVCYRKPVIRSAEFREFWKNVTPIEGKGNLVKSYEVGLSKLLSSCGFTMSQYFNLSLIDHLRACPRVLKRKVADVPINLNPYKYLRNLLVFTNPTFYYYEEMLKRKVPTIKVSLIRRVKFRMPATNLWNVNGINLEMVGIMREHLHRTGFVSDADEWTPNDRDGS